MLSTDGVLIQVLEEFDTISRFVKDNEPGVLRYELAKGIPEKNGGADVVVIREMSVLLLFNALVIADHPNQIRIGSRPAVSP